MLILGFLIIQYWYFVDEIIENTKLSRLGMLTLTGPDFISEFSIDTFGEWAAMVMSSLIK